MSDVVKVVIYENMNFSDVVENVPNKLNEIFDKDQMVKVSEAFQFALSEHIKTLPKDLVNITVRYLKPEKIEKGRTVRLMEINTKFIQELEDDQKKVVDVTFEYYLNSDGVEDCDLLNYYSADYKTNRQRENEN